MLLGGKEEKARLVGLVDRREAFESKDRQITLLAGHDHVSNVILIEIKIS